MNLNELFISFDNLPGALDTVELNVLFKQMKLGNEEAREKIINHNIKLVIYLINRKFNRANCEKKELVSVGLMALIRAVDTFDISKNFAFSTYASKCICNEICKYLNKDFRYNDNKSLDESVGDIYNNVTLIDTIQATDDVVYEYEENEYCMILRRLVNELPAKEKDIISMYFGFYNGKIYTLKEIANKYNTTSTTISTFIAKIKFKLKKQLVEEYNTETKEGKSLILR